MSAMDGQLWAVLDARGRVIGDHVAEQDVPRGDPRFAAEYPGRTAVRMEDVPPGAYDGPAESCRRPADCPHCGHGAGLHGPLGCVDEDAYDGWRCECSLSPESVAESLAAWDRRPGPVDSVEA